MNKKFLIFGVCIASITVLGACSGSSSGKSATVQGDIPIAYVKRSNEVPLNPTDAGNTQSDAQVGGDLYIRELSSPSATEYNITGARTQGKGDVSRPEVSYDGKKIVFAMRCSANTPCSQEAGKTDTTWSIWEYDFSNAKTLNQGSLRRVMSIDDASKGDDYDPAYLPGGQGYVFTSRRQAKSSDPSSPNQPGYPTLDEYERERVANLHTMDAKGGNIKQISFNQSHDRSPTVLQNGRIMYARWDHVGGRNHFSIFTMKPDGTDMFVLYGAHSPGNSRLHPREMQDGKVVTDLMPLSRTQEGGALMVLDVQNYSEENTPANSSVPRNGGQQQATKEPLDFDARSISINGRVTTPYPLWDGTHRVLVGYSPCQVTKNGKVVPCASLTSAELFGFTQDRLQTAIDADPVKDNAPVSYSIQMFDLQTQTFRTVVPAVAQMIVKDPVALMPRKEPNTLTNTLSATAPETGTLSVRSVYDTDGLERMGDKVLSTAELTSTPIPKITPTDPEDTRSQVADIAVLKDPATSAYRKRPARFVRITKAIATPQGIAREAIGETEFEMQQILGYADVEPDGSFKVDVPADTPIAITVTDAKGRAFQAHTNWIQVRPGEQRTCDGCHSPRRGAALNSGTLLGNHPNTLLTAMSGDTMADTRVRIDPTTRNLKPHIEFADVWAKTAALKTPCVSLRYSGSTTCPAYNADVLVTAAPVPAADGSIAINYPDHIQPLWERHCGGGCHTRNGTAKGTARLDLSHSPSGTGRMISYQKLLVGDPAIDGNGFPVTRIEEGVKVLVTGPALVNNMASQGDAGGMARKSRLIEILSGDVLKASTEARTAFPDPATAPLPPPDHTKMLNAAEMRLLAEWIDLGGQYYNNPFQNGAPRVVAGLNRATFDSTIHPILMSTCANCHQAGGSTNSTTPAPTFQNNRFVLTGGGEGDFNVTLSMVRDVCTPQTSYLLAKPSAIPHPSTLVQPHPVTAVLPNPSNDYNKIYNWIGAACAPPVTPRPTTP